MTRDRRVGPTILVNDTVHLKRRRLFNSTLGFITGLSLFLTNPIISSKTKNKKNHTHNTKTTTNPQSLTFPQKISIFSLRFPQNFTTPLLPPPIQFLVVFSNSNASILSWRMSSPNSSLVSFLRSLFKPSTISAFDFSRPILSLA